MRVVLLSLLLLLCLADVPEYEVTKETKDTSSITLQLNYMWQDDYYITPKSPIVNSLILSLKVLSYHDFQLKIYDPSDNRFEVPQGGVFPLDPLITSSFPLSASAIEVKYNFSPFDITITRKSTQAVLFSTVNTSLVFSDKYLEITTQIDSQFIYGIGQRFSESFRKKNGTWTIFNRDRGLTIDKGEGFQTYGYYPFYFLREKSNRFHINYLRSSNAMDVIISSNDSLHYVTYKVIGGVFDFRFFIGEDDPQLTLMKMNQYVGRSAIPPFWSLGYHQCRWGYDRVEDLENMISGFMENGIPLDNVWSDIDYMLDFQDFTVDQTRFPLDRMKAIAEDYNYIPIVDAGIKTSGSAYEKGLAQDVFIKEAGSGQPLKGNVWPGETTFVDFFHPNATQYWIDQLEGLYSQVKFSGLWLDMNEYANFCDGPCSPPQGNFSSTFNYAVDLPYQPGADSIESRSIPLNSTHYSGLEEADVHAFGAFLQTYSTNLFLQSKGKRPFIITRSSTFGSNRYGFHWTGDNVASWDFLRGSIADNFNNQFYGFQMVGPDICGFGDNTTEQLCARWYQIGALYTFCRNHNINDSISQQPFALGDTVMQAAKTNLKVRYSLLKYFYSLFVSKRGYGSIWRPLFFEFPSDEQLYTDYIADTQFMIGPDMMSAPILYEGARDRLVYFPFCSWYDLHTGKQYEPGQHLISNISLTDKVPLFVQQGRIVSLQNATLVTRIAQLDNSFILFTGMEYQATASNITHQYYAASGALLSIEDYGKDSTVTECVSVGCQYVISMRAELTPPRRALVIDVTYIGGRGLQERVEVRELRLNLGGVVYVLKPQVPIAFTGPERIKIDIPHQYGSADLQDLTN